MADKPLPPVTKPGDEFLKLILEELREIRSSLQHKDESDPPRKTKQTREPAR